VNLRTLAVLAAILLPVLPHGAARADDDDAARTKMKFRAVGVPGNHSFQKTLAEPMEILAWSWGASRGAPTGPSSTQDISMTKYTGLESPALFALVANGGTINKVVVEVRNKDLITITLYDVYVSSLSTGGSGGETRLTENVTLSFGAYEIETQVTDQGGLKQTRSSGKITIPQPPR
jgi:type VI secretion system secreted protein Hcp